LILELVARPIDLAWRLAIAFGYLKFGSGSVEFAAYPRLIRAGALSFIVLKCCKFLTEFSARL
jgi:hypothetical protein